ncbi:MAG: hypothetical protein IT304_01050 [Dehalococcoidia bacterium]|nr:hypothetical protein [Dehalococcoidia bacterium]
MTVSPRSLRDRFAVGEGLAQRLSGIDSFTVLVACAFALAVAVRAVQVLGTSFPLNDGGLFYAMVRDLEANHFVPPHTTSYNDAQIPFAYPPLAFYLAAAVDKATPFNLVDLFRYLPLLFTCATVGAFYLLARDMLRGRVAVVAALAAFALIPRSFIWLLMGGGLTRSLGLLFALLALHQVYRLYRDGDGRRLPLAVALSAATVLSHLETGWFLAFSVALFWAFCGRGRKAALHSAWLAAGTAALTAPWWGTIIAWHGLDPFTAANGTGGTVLSNAQTRDFAFLTLAHGVSTSEPFFPLLGALGLLGGFACFVSRRFLLPAWWVAIVLFDVRSFATFSSVPVALLAGIAVAEVLLPLFDRPGALGRLVGRSPAPGVAVWLAPAFIFGCMLYFAAYGALGRDPRLGEQATLTSLTPGEREAMAWIAATTPTDSRFLVIPQTFWQADRESEWFPVLANRPSVATVQGSEWLPAQAFDRQIGAHARAWGCAWAGTDCLDGWMAAHGATFTHVYLPNGCCGGLADALRTDPRYQLVYDGPGGVVYRLGPIWLL